jgi:hypothetical protein
VAYDLIMAFAADASLLINNQNQRGSASCDRASHNSTDHGRVYRNQHVTSKRAAELGEGLLRNRYLKVLRIEERGW